MPYRVLAQQALARWREAERRKDAAVPHSPGWEAADRDAVAARLDYMQCVEDARRELLPEPPAFDEAIASEPKTDMSAVGEDGQAYGG
jgi:hypothetical protein